MIHETILKFLRDSLFHFLFLGAALFAGYAAVNGSVDAPADRIVVDKTQVLRLVEQFQQT